MEPPVVKRLNLGDRVVLKTPFPQDADEKFDQSSSNEDNDSEEDKSE